eukprot:1160966-Pelagomonas_calceolata.AAC.7
MVADSCNILAIPAHPQGILSSFFYKYADTILKKYSSTIATIFTALMSWVLFGHSLTVNFILGVSIVLISMHQVFAPGPLLPPATFCSLSLVLSLCTNLRLACAHLARRLRCSRHALFFLRGRVNAHLMLM